MTQQNSEMQSLGQRAYVVFMQSYYLDEVLWQTIGDASRCLQHVGWCREIEKLKYHSSRDDYSKFVSVDGYEQVYDPYKNDWNFRGEENSRQLRSCICHCYSRLASDTRYGVEFEKLDSGEPVLPKFVPGTGLFYRLSLEPYGHKPRVWKLKRKLKPWEQRNVERHLKLMWEPKPTRQVTVPHSL